MDIAAGGNFGEFSALDGKSRSANVFALTDANITIIPSEVFMGILHKYPSSVLNYCNSLPQLSGGCAIEYSNIPPWMYRTGFIWNYLECRN